MEGKAYGETWAQDRMTQDERQSGRNWRAMLEYLHMLKIEANGVF